MEIAQYSQEAFTAYVAGMLDGEGYIEIDRRLNSIRIRIASTYLQVLHDIHQRMGIGNVHPYKRPAHYRPLSVYTTTNAADSGTLLRMCRPYLQIKAARADEALEIIGRMQRRVDDLDARNRLILEAIAAGELQKDIGKRFDLSQTAVSRIKLGHTWQCEIDRLNARRGVKKGLKPSDAIFRLHGLPPA